MVDLKNPHFSTFMNEWLWLARTNGLALSLDGRMNKEAAPHEWTKLKMDELLEDGEITEVIALFPTKRR